jgi:glutaredoxin
MPRRTCHALLAALVATPLLFFATAPAQAGCSKRVYLYSTSWCPYCRQVRAILARNHIRYTLLDATTARVQADMIRRFGDTAVPRMLIGGALVEGVDEARIKQLCRGRPGTLNQTRLSEPYDAAASLSASTWRGNTGLGAGNTAPDFSRPLGPRAAKSRASEDTPS